MEEEGVPNELLTTVCAFAYVKEKRVGRREGEGGERGTSERGGGGSEI